MVKVRSKKEELKHIVLHFPDGYPSDWDDLVKFIDQNITTNWSSNTLKKEIEDGVDYEW